MYSLYFRCIMGLNHWGRPYCLSTLLYSTLLYSTFVYHPTLYTTLFLSCCTVFFSALPLPLVSHLHHLYLCILEGCKCKCMQMLINGGKCKYMQLFWLLISAVPVPSVSGYYKHGAVQRLRGARHQVQSVLRPHPQAPQVLWDTLAAPGPDRVRAHATLWAAAPGGRVEVGACHARLTPVFCFC